MEGQPHLQDDFWKEFTHQLCATIAKGVVTYASDCLDRIFAEAEHEDPSLSTKPSSEQAAEDAEYAKLAELRSSAGCHADATDVKRVSSENLEINSPAEEDLNFFDLDSSATQDLNDPQIASDTEPTDLTPTGMPTTTPPSSRTITPGETSDPPMSVAREDLNGTPTPAFATTIAAHDMMSPPTSPANVEGKSPKRKPTLGMPVLAGDDEVRMPPPKLRKASPTVEEQVFSSFVNTNAVATPSAELIFRDIRQPSTAYNPPENNIPKTPMLVEFSIPPSPAPSVFQESDTSKIHSLDWRIIFHALDNNADRRIPLQDTTTMPQMSEEQVNVIWSRFSGDATEKATLQAEWLRDFRKAQMSESGLKWTELRGNYSRDPPEYTPRTSQDICNDQTFRIFCGLANFVGGRPAVMPKGPALRNTFGVLKYARLANQRPRPCIGNLPQSQLELFPQQAVPTGLAPLLNDHTALEDNTRFHPSRPPTPAPTPAPTHLLAPAQLLSGSTTAQMPNLPPSNRNASLLERAYHDIRVFLSLPVRKLFGMEQQFIRDRARHFTQQNLPVPRDNPTGRQLWGYFRQNVYANSLHRARQIQVARHAQVAREMQAGAEAQASMIKNPFAETAYEGRDLQLQSHMPPTHLMPPMTPEARSMGRGNVGVTALGSPFRTPARGRRDCVDPRLLHS